MNGWQPIETAPKDGTPILSWDGVEQAIVKWCACHNYWLLHPTTDTFDTWEFTHWRALGDSPVKSLHDIAVRHAGEYLEAAP